MTASKPSINPTGLVTSEQLAAYWNVSRVCIHKWRKRGMPHMRITSRTFLYNVEKVVAWCNAHNVDLHAVSKAPSRRRRKRA